MLRNIVAVVLAVVVGNLLIFGGEAVNGAIYPPSPGFNFDDPAAVQAMVANMPLGAFAGVELSYLVASAGAGAVVAKVARSRHLALAGAVGVLFTAANFMNMAEIHHSLWFAVLTTVTFVPVTLGVARLLRPGT